MWRASPTARGRNSVFMDGQGHRVTAFDASPVNVDKARARSTRW